MSDSRAIFNQVEVRELAISLFKSDEALQDDFFAEIATGSISDELLIETGCWSDAQSELADKYRE